jgi:hypothetical protein
VSAHFKFLVLNTKGGVGKSTLVSQVLAPYIYKKTKNPVTIYEFDDENNESRYFGASKIINYFPIYCGKKDLRDEVADVLLGEESICMDVGAGKTSKVVMQALMDSGLLKCVDLLVIPLMDGETDATNALNVYRALKESEPELKVIFALGRVNEARELHCQFDHFFGDSRGFFNIKGIYNLLAPEDRSYIALKDADVVKYSRIFGITIWELANLKRDLGADLKKAIEEKESVDKIKLLSFKHALQKDSIQYLKTTLLKAFETIDKRIGIGGEKDD